MRSYTAAKVWDGVNSIRGSNLIYIYDTGAVPLRTTLGCIVGGLLYDKIFIMGFEMGIFIIHVHTSLN